MADVYIVRRGGTGGGNPFAMILVNYPQGSTVTCTNSSGSKDISQTKKLFYISGRTVPFDCVVTSTNGVKTATKTVSITHEGQGEEVTLVYELVLFTDGVTSGFTPVGWGASSSMANVKAPDIVFGETLYAHINSFGGQHGAVLYNNPVDLSSYSTISLTIDSSSSIQGHTDWWMHILGVWNVDEITNPMTGYYTDSNKLVAYSEIATKGTTITLDVSQYSGEHYIGIAFRANGQTESSSTKIYVSDWRVT